MNRAFHRTSVALIVFVFSISTKQNGLALGIRLGDQDPFATSRANAFAATADNPSAVFYNPAGIVQLEGHNIQFGAYGLFYEVDYSDGPDGASADTVDQLYGVPQFFYTYTPENESRFSYGFGIYSTFGLGSEWPKNGPFRSHATKSNITYLTANPVVAAHLTNDLSIALGLTVNYGHGDLRRGILAPGDEFRFVADGWGVGFNVGLFWQPHPKHAFGLTYRSESKVDFDGRTETKSKTPGLFPSSRVDAESTIRFPRQLVLGYSFRPTPEWNIEVNLEWTDWNSFDTFKIKTDAATLVEPMGWNDSVIVSLGVTRILENGIYLSAGYWYAEKTVPDKTFNPRVPDMDFHVFSLGIGYATDTWKYFLVYEMGFGGKRKIRGSPVTLAGESADGKYRYRSYAVQLAARRSF